MRTRLINLARLFRTAAHNWYEHNCLRLGASLSYYTLLSLFPLILVVLTIIRMLLVNSDAAREVIIDALASVTGGFGNEFDTALEAARSTRRGSGIIGTAILLLGASWVFGELVSAFNIIWSVQAPDQGGPFQFLRTTFLSFALVLAGAFLLLVSMIISAMLTMLGEWMRTLPGGVLVWSIAHFFVNLAVLALVFALLFKFLPQTYVAWNDVWLGAILTALVGTLLQLAISYYISFSNYGTYGPVGAVLALVVWVYMSSQVLFLGGEFTAAYAENYGSRAGGYHPQSVLDAEQQSITDRHRRDPQAAK